MFDNEYEICETCPIFQQGEGAHEPAIWERDRLLAEYEGEVPDIEQVDDDLFVDIGTDEKVRDCIKLRKLGQCLLTTTGERL